MMHDLLPRPRRFVGRGSEPESFGWSMRSLAVRLAPGRIVLSSSHGGEQERVRAAARIDDRAFAKEMQLFRDFKPPTAFNKIETSLLSNQAGQTDIGRGRTHLVYVMEAQICVHLC
jgi:hypothetical protein